MNEITVRKLLEQIERKRQEHGDQVLDYKICVECVSVESVPASSGYKTHKGHEGWFFVEVLTGVNYIDNNKKLLSIAVNY